MTSRILPLVLAVGLVMACGDDDDPTDNQDHPNDHQGSTASGLYETDEGFQLDLAFDPDPPQAGAVDLIMEITLDEAPVEGAQIDVEPWMPAHGHGSNTEAEVHEMGDGQYQVDDLSFSMPGHWELTIDVEAQEEHSKLVVDLNVEG